MQPNLSDTYRVKAYFHSMLLEQKEAVACAEKAYELEPLSFNNVLSLGDIFYRVRRFDDAIQLLKPLIDKYPDSSMAKEILGNCYFAKGDLENAASIYRHLDALPRYANLYSSGRFIYALKHGDRQIALNYYAHLQELAKTNWVNPILFALLRFALGEETKAIATIKEAITVKAPGIIYIVVDHVWEDYRNHPAVKHLLNSIGLTT